MYSVDDLEQEPTIDEAEVELARRKHSSFIQYLWVGSDSFIPGRQIDIICDRIDKAMHDFRNGKSTFLCIKVPFRHSKSTILSRYLPCKFIGEFPDKEVIVATYSASLCQTFSRFARNVMRSEEYASIYPGTRLSAEEQSVASWGIEGRQGKVHWLGMEGSVTGKGASLLLIDDFFKGREEASSDTVREKRWDVITNELLTRRSDPSIVIILATPWHIDDPFGRIREQMKVDPKYPRFEEIRIPARDSAYPTGYLWSEKFSNEWYESQFATLGPYYSSSLLQCDPTPRFGNIFRVDKIKLYDEPPDDVVWTRGWDLASSEKSRISPDPDYTVGVKLGVRWMASGIEGQSIPIIFIDDMIRGRWEAMQRKNIIKDTAIGDGQMNVGVENFGNYKDAYTELSQILSGLRVVKGVQLPGDKVTKWAAIEAAMAAGNVHMRRADWNTDLTYEMSLAPSGKHDDICDAISVAYALHNPHLKLVWPSYANMRTVPMRIDWGKANPYHTLHYGALTLRPDLSLYFLGALWDRVSSKLYVYTQLYWKNCNQIDVVQKLVTAMRFKEYRVDKFIGSENMFSQNMFEKSVAKQLNRQIKTMAIPEYVTIHEPVHFNFYGAIQQGEELFRNDNIVISNQCPEAARQFAGWAIQKGKPATEDCGYCECLCLILSELQRKRVLSPDEVKKKIYEKIS